MFLVPKRIDDHVQLLVAWSTVSQLRGEIHLPQALNDADDDENAAIETYSMLRQGRG